MNNKLTQFCNCEEISGVAHQNFLVIILRAFKFKTLNKIKLENRTYVVKDDTSTYINESGVTTMVVVKHFVSGNIIFYPFY